MQEITTRAFAKINLSLDVLGKLDNGYHSVKMVMQSVSVFDIVTVKKIKSGIELSTNLPYLPIDSKNLAYRAAEEFFKHTNITNCGVSIDISKRIPVGAGLAGGSSNAAAVLKAMNKLFETKLPLKVLCKIGVNIGADVPYCILGGTRLAEGIGEKLSSLPRIPKCGILLVKPPFSISTKSAYEKVDSSQNLYHPDTEKIICGLKDQDLSVIISGMNNVLESVIAEEHSVISEIKDDLLKNGAIAAQMSGSGPTVFGIFNTYDEARKIKKYMQEKYKTAYICTPV